MPVGIDEKRTWPDMSITRPVCCGQASSNNPEVSVPSFSVWPTFTHLSQTPSANSQLSNKYSPIHFRPLRETKGGVKRKKWHFDGCPIPLKLKMLFFHSNLNLSPFLSSRTSVFLTSLCNHLFLISVLSPRVSSNVRGQRAVPEFCLHLHLGIHICGVTDLPQVQWKGSALLFKTLMRPPSENMMEMSQETPLSHHCLYFTLLYSVDQSSSESPSQAGMSNRRIGWFYLTILS